VQHKLLATLTAVGMLGMVPAAAAGIITFDEVGLSDGQNLAGTTGNPTDVPGITYGINVPTGPNGGTALVWDTQTSHGTGDSDIEGLFDDPSTPGDDAYNPGNILVLGNDTDEFPNDDPDGGSIEVVFSQLVSTFSVNLYDTGDSGSTGVEVFVNGASQGVFGDELGDNEFGTFTYGPGSGTITTLTFSGSGGFDDLRFRQVQVPVPATFALLGGGLVALGFALRRRRAG
jgi:hypothetical protein